MQPGRQKVKRKPLKKWYINGEFSKNREDGKKELERHSGEVYADPEETFEEQRIEWYRKKGRNILPGKIT